VKELFEKIDKTSRQEAAPRIESCLFNEEGEAMLVSSPIGMNPAEPVILSIQNDRITVSQGEAIYIKQTMSAESINAIVMASRVYISEIDPVEGRSVIHTDVGRSLSP
jgi:hypothetical protein